MTSASDIISRAAAAAGIGEEAGRAVAAAMASAIRERCSQLDTIAIPGFGNFVPVKTDEHIVAEPDGSRVLVPPHVALTFNPGSMLRKRLSANE
ncbi:MAG: HU family DNA-binding protein [Muribaculaceae bacterium]|nr:HU family DNA-binding protein [Muribaculaceae bacterium]